MANTVNKNVIVPEVYAGLVREKIAGRVQVAQFLKTIDTLHNDVGETITMPAWSYIGDASDWSIGTAMTTKSMVQTSKKATVKAVAAPGIQVFDYDNQVVLEIRLMRRQGNRQSPLLERLILMQSTPHMAHHSNRHLQPRILSHRWNSSKQLEFLAMSEMRKIFLVALL